MIKLILKQKNKHKTLFKQRIPINNINSITQHKINEI